IGPEGSGKGGALKQRRLQSSKSCLSLVNQGLEGLRLVDGDVREDLAVNFDFRLAQTVDKSAIGQAVFAGCGIDALDPERTEIALLGPAIAIGVLACLLDRLIGDAEGILATAIIAFRGLENFTVTGVRSNAPFYAR